jgi:hypothetical protein
MTLWQTASIAFFLYVLAVLAVRGAGSRTAALRVVIGSIAGLAAVLVSALDRTPWFLANVIVPPLVLLIGYWTSGRLFLVPIPWQESALLRLDDRAGIVALARRTPRVVAELLEAAYVGVYGLVPIAFVLHLYFSSRPDASRFWAVILVTDFICFAFLPWVQTRPPRALENAEPWDSTFRALNLRLLGSTSIQVNTFPSGHAAEGLAAALLVIGAPPPITVLMAVGALAVAAGAVLGRYHYLADALAGFVVAAVVWWFIAATP